MAALTELCSEANEQYVNENYQKAVELYTQALGIDDRRDDIYCHRAQAYLQLGKLAEAVEDYDKALQLNDNNNKAYVKKGSILYEMNEFAKALDVFKEGQKQFASDKILEDWIHRCETELAKQPNENDSTEAKNAQHVQNLVSNEPPKVKYNWYQTHTHVIVSAMVKNVAEENLTVDAKSRTLKLSVKRPDDPVLTLDLTLAHQIDPQQTATKIYSTKVEIKLKKKEGIQWSTLEGSPQEEASEVLPACAAPVQQPPPKYPSSSHHTRDWDRLAAEVTEEEKNEKLEGDAALNQFFQKIYSDASDDTKKAMMKSFMESGGTVLSTNWEEVGSKRVEVKPPDGMEFKKWET
ncbi:hypothetical protein BsWGS_17678 [Bradybaena similaris]